MFNQNLLKIYGIEDESHVITHHRSVYFSPFFDMVIILFVLYFLRYVAMYVSGGEIFTKIVAILAVIAYIKTIIDFFNLYLDAMVIARNGVTIYRWKSLTDYETEHFHRDKIEAMNHAQNSWSDRIFDKGDLRVLLEHGTTYRFTNVDRPTHHSAVFLNHQNKHEMPTESHHGGGHDERLDILIEAMGEVVKEYIDEKSIREEPKQQRPGRRK